MDEELNPSQALSGMLQRAPIPGQSLTTPMGHTPMERPAKMTDTEEILEFFWDKMHEPMQFKMVLASLEAGMPAELLMRSLVLGAMFNGYISLDSAMIIAQTVYGMICAIGDRAGIKYQRRMKGKSNKEQMDDFLDDIASSNISDKQEDMAEGEVDMPEDDMMEDMGEEEEEDTPPMPSMNLLGGGEQ